MNTGVGWPPRGDRPDPGIEPVSLTSPALASGFFTASANLESVSSVTELSDSLWSHGLQHARPPCWSLTLPLWKSPLKDFIQEGVQGISTKHVRKCLVRGDKFTLRGILGERVTADMWKMGTVAKYKAHALSIRGSQKIFPTWKHKTLTAIYFPFAREDRHLDFDMNYTDGLMLAWEKIKYGDKGNADKSFIIFIWRATSL